MRLIAGVNVLGLYLYLCFKTENRIYWLDFGFYIYNERYTLVEISTTRKAVKKNEIVDS